MAVSKRLRFEILRRDNHACRYCGRSAPDVELTVDHVVPVALGGSDDPSNLVAACRDCNAGKSSVPADANVVDDVAQDALRWARAMEQAAAERAADHARAEELHGQFGIEWESWTDGYGHTTPKPGSWSATVDQFLNAGLSMADLHELIAVAMESKAHDPWRYFCGCCWKRIGQLQERAREIVEASGSTTADSAPSYATRWTKSELKTHLSRITGALVSQHDFAEGSVINLANYSCPHAESLDDCGDLICAYVALNAMLECLSSEQHRESRRDIAVLDELEVLLDG